MALRLLEVFITAAGGAEVKDVLEEHEVHGFWSEPFSEERVLVKVLLESEHTEAVMHALEERFGDSEDFHLILLPVEAALPRPEKPEEKKETAPTPEEPPEKARPRISAEELYNDISDSIRSTSIFFVLVFLSTIVAAVGLFTGNVAVIIGAMVIAPLLGPNVALSLATTLGEVDLGRRAIRIGLGGLFLALSLSILIGAVFPADPSMPEIAPRTQVGLADIALALASGSAGALAFTTGVSAALVGVMVAVALLPPLVTLGLMAGGGHPVAALGALGLVLVNVICINLSGVLTFLAQGVRPRSFWDADKARRGTIRAVASWVILLVALAAIIQFTRL